MSGTDRAASSPRGAGGRTGPDSRPDSRSDSRSDGPATRPPSPPGIRGGALPQGHPSGAASPVGAAAARLRRVEATAASVFAGWGYREVVAPLFDYAEVFARSGRWSERASYRFTEAGDLFALRSDFTPLVARIAAANPSPGLSRLFYRGDTVRRQERRLLPATGCETGIEHFAGGPAADLETLLVAVEVLERLGVEGFLITLGHAGYPLALLEAALAAIPEDADPAAARREALAGLYRRDRARLRAALGPAAAPLVSALDRSGGPEALGGFDLAPLPARAREAVAELRGIAEALGELGLADRFGFDLAELRGFDYYTGLVFEIHAPGAGVEIGGGGRYDDLFGRYGAERPAVGFAIGVDRLAGLLGDSGSDGPPVTPIPLPPADAGTLSPAGGLAAAFASAREARRRNQRIRLEPSPAPPGEPGRASGSSAPSSLRGS